VGAPSTLCLPAVNGVLPAVQPQLSAPAGDLYAAGNDAYKIPTAFHQPSPLGHSKKVPHSATVAVATTESAAGVGLLAAGMPTADSSGFFMAYEMDTD